VKSCSRCGELKPLDGFHRKSRSKSGLNPECKACACVRNKQWRQDNPEKVKANNARPRRDWHLRNKFGITEQQFEDLREVQGGVCAICDSPCETHPNLSVDHNHTTGANRGLLCFNCNVGVGKFDEDPELLRRAADYLELPSLFEALA